MASISSHLLEFDPEVAAGVGRCLALAGDARDGITMTARLLALAMGKSGLRARLQPEAPAEIRAPANSLAGVIATILQTSLPGKPLEDRVGLFLAMNPAALKLHGNLLEPGGLLIVNADAFTSEELQLAGYSTDPLKQELWGQTKIFQVPMAQLAGRAINAARQGKQSSLLSSREVDRLRHLFALGMLLWNTRLSTDTVLHWMEEKYGANPSLLEAARKTLQSGFLHGNNAGLPGGPAGGGSNSSKGTWRLISGNEAAALALRSVAEQLGRPVLLATTAQPPANELASEASSLAGNGLAFFLADDDAGAAAAALGASFGGGLGCTATNGPGLAHQGEIIGMAAQAELPLLTLSCQRAGIAQGLPQGVAQEDLAAAIFGRHGEAPMVVLSPDSPADTFALTRLAARTALRFLTPVCILQDLLTTHGVETWQVPEKEELPGFDLPHFAPDLKASPYSRDELLARPWVTPGMPEGEHCLGGFERQAGTARVSYHPADHAEMNRLREERLKRIARFLGPLEVEGDPGEFLLLGWGGTRSVLESAAQAARAQGLALSYAHLRVLFPLPFNMAEVIGSFKKVVVAELNAGRLFHILKSQFEFNGVSLPRRDARNFRAEEIVAFLLQQREEQP